MSVGFAVQLSPVPMVDYVSPAYHTETLGLHCDQLASSLFTCLVRHAPRVWKLPSVAQVESGKWPEIYALIEIFYIPKIRVIPTRYSGPFFPSPRKRSGTETRLLCSKCDLRTFNDPAYVCALCGGLDRLFSASGGRLDPWRANQVSSSV